MLMGDDDHVASPDATKEPLQRWRLPSELWKIIGDEPSFSLS
jgi:hypothetical protein